MEQTDVPRMGQTLPAIRGFILRRNKLLTLFAVNLMAPPVFVRIHGMNVGRGLMVNMWYPGQSLTQCVQMPGYVSVNLKLN